MKQAILQAQDLEKSYQGRKVVNGFSLELFPGEVVGLLGPNGAGKTTAFYMLMGLVRPDAGRLLLHSQEITHASVTARAKMGMGYLAQEPSIFRKMSVADNILCILEQLPLSKAQRLCKLEELLQELHLTALADKIAGTLSGGERRRLEITRALIHEPTCLLLDEPFANIDPISVCDVKEMIQHLLLKNISILITDHNAREIFSIVDRSYLVCDGKVVCHGSVDTLVNDPYVQKIYLGTDFKL